MSSYKLLNGILWKDEIMSTCPLAPGMPGRDKFNQIIINRFTCGLSCPHFLKEANEVTLKCVIDNKFILESEVKQSNSKLIN